MINRNIGGTFYCITETYCLTLPESHPLIKEVPSQYRGKELRISEGFSLNQDRERVLIIEGHNVETVVRKKSDIFRV